MKPQVKQKLFYRLPRLHIVGAVAATDTQILVHNSNNNNNNNNNSIIVPKWSATIC
jgi:hypothetical protein